MSEQMMTAFQNLDKLQLRKESLLASLYQISLREREKKRKVCIFCYFCNVVKERKLLLLPAQKNIVHLSTFGQEYILYSHFKNHPCKTTRPFDVLHKNVSSDPAMTKRNGANYAPKYPPRSLSLPNHAGTLFWAKMAP